MELIRIQKMKYIYAGLAINIVIILFTLLVQGRMPPQVPLFYGLPRGEAQLTKPIWLTIPATFSLILILINYFLIKVIRDSFTIKVLGLISLLTAIFAAVTTVKIIFLVGQL